MTEDERFQQQLDRILTEAEVCTRTIKKIYVHTQAYPGAKDSTVEDIRRYHVNSRGFWDIGYHVVVRKCGDLCLGRLFNRVGCGVKGDNRTSLHVCFNGHADLKPWTPLQMVNGITMLSALVEAFELVPYNVVGHREHWARLGQPPRKTCPGKLIDMDQVREEIGADLAMRVNEEPPYPGESDYD